MSKKKKHRNRLPMKNVCKDFLDQLDRFRREAQQRGLVAEIRRPRCCNGNVQTIHVMINYPGGRRVLDYWPGTGRVWIPWTGKKAKAKDCWEALDMAGRGPSNRQERKQRNRPSEAKPVRPEKELAQWIRQPEQPPKEPQPREDTGSYCERCEELTHSIRLYNDIMLCPTCVEFYAGIESLADYQKKQAETPFHTETIKADVETADRIGR